MVIETTPACHPSWVGVDVGKESLAIHIVAGNKALTIANKAPAIKDFLKQHPGATLVLESTGGYEAEVIALAIESGHAVYRVTARASAPLWKASASTPKPTPSTRKPWLTSPPPTSIGCIRSCCLRRR